jgi:hypothetical protein
MSGGLRAFASGVRRGTARCRTVDRATRPRQTLLFALLLNATGTGLYLARAPIYLTKEPGEHREEAPAAPFVHSGVQGRDRRSMPARRPVGGPGR